MKVLVVGSGGREHAIVWKLSQSPKIDRLYCAPGNGGISRLAECVAIKATDIDSMISFAKENRIDLVVVAPDDPLVLGMVDALTNAGIMAFGPTKAAAIIEGSKAFSKELMRKYHIPTAGYEIFDKSIEALAYIRKQNTYPTVIKADGLALGKGVVIAQNEAEAEEALHSIMDDRVFGASGSRVVIEEFLSGHEVSVLCFTDGKTIAPMVSAQDHKRAYDNDQGPNTGGMGTFSPSRVYTKEIADLCETTIFRPTVDAMNQEERRFQGVLYFGLILTASGPKVIEYNCRFGDPETQVVLPRLESDLLDIFIAVVKGKLEEQIVTWKDNACVCIVTASGGYPKHYEIGKLISGLKTIDEQDDIVVFHAGTKLTDGNFYTAGGRVLGITAQGNTLNDAIDKAYKAVKEVSFSDMHYRTDIGIK